MRIALLLVLAPLALPAACSSNAQTTTLPEAGADGAGDDGGMGMPIPKTETCTGAMTSCLYGTAKTTGFTATPARMQVTLYRVFPSGSEPALMTIPVALDGTWALSNVPAWSHYYVQVAADFGQKTAAPARVIGPLTLPSAGALPALEVPPVQLAVLEQAASGAYQVDWAVAHVFDPASGAEITSTANVSIAVGGTSTPMTWGPVPGSPSTSAYVASFASPPAAQASYTVTTVPTTGAMPATWSLVAVTPAFTPTLAAPAASATVPVGQALPVSWPAQPAADYEVVELFIQSGGQWSALYSSAQPDAPDTTMEAVPAAAVATAGTYLVDVNFANASCPPTANGCVLATIAATAQITAQ